MAMTTVKTKNYKIGYNNLQKKNGINLWRFFFTGKNERTNEENSFFLEFETINPALSPSQIISSLKQKEIRAEDLQSALIGNSTDAIKDNSIKPSYCVMRIAKLGKNGKQLCEYFPISELQYNQKDFELKYGNKLITDNQISGFITVSSEDLIKKSECLTDQGYATWHLEYKIIDSVTSGYKHEEGRWFPLGLKTVFSGRINFDGEDYLVHPKISTGYIDRYFGSGLLKKWMHIHCSDLTSLISGKKIENSAFCIQGIFGERVSLQGNIEDIPLSFQADKSKHSYNCVFDCSQLPGIEQASEQQLHWSFSINDKKWIIDIEIYCRLNELLNRFLESPDGSKKGLNLLEGGSGYGEVKIYHQNGKSSIEQIEQAKLSKVMCEFGESDIYGE